MRSVLIALLSLATTSAIAADIPVREWTQEPESVIGIKLGAPLAASTLPVCVRPGRDNNWKQAEAVCISEPIGPYAETVRLLDGLPWKDVRISGSVSLFDGKVKAVTFDVNHEDYEKFRGILIARYGAPATAEAGTVTSNAGAVLASETLRWFGKNASLIVIERLRRIDHASVTFFHNALAADAIKAEKSDTEKAASKF